MPTAPKQYNAALKHPPDGIPYLLPDGNSVLLPIWKEVGTDTDLVCCDLCGLFYIVYANRSLAALTRHRGKAACQKAASKKANVESGTLTFLHGFDNVGPSQEHSPVTTFSTPSPAPEIRPFDGPTLVNIRSSLPPSSPPSHSLVDETSFDVRLSAKNREHYICNGQRIRWIAGPTIWDTYTFPKHADEETTQWTPLSFEPPNHIWLIRCGMLHGTGLQQQACAKDLLQLPVPLREHESRCCSGVKF
ncbi:hypothetical protein D9619_010710 [Psilocybe cf. subviscida]|uniref:Uncharacterized protein n=1 Tax=Psilocybe cf. subviscida TaxID=2480587 RepID=A0A8H5F0D4_9AGAR|nr:hypothetical protein D9619_010710 [Psilocybe cf. subviscida]